MMLWSSVPSALGALGCAYALFSYAGDGALLWAALSGALTLGLSLLSCIRKKNALRLFYALLFCLLAAPLLFHDAFLKSGLALLSSLVELLKEPYDLDMTAPQVQPNSSALLGRVYLSLLLSWFFTAGCISRIARGIAGLLSLLVLLTGFYFGVSVPPLAVILLTAYLLTLPVSLLSRGLGRPEIPAFGIALLLGIFLLVLYPESHYTQPELFSSAQEKILSLTDPYDPVFHAGNGYTGMMKGAAGHQKLGRSPGVRYSGRIIADIESAPVSAPLYIRSWTGGAYEENQWKDLPDSAYDNYQRLFAKNQGEWYDQGAWLMEVVARNPSISQKLLNYTDKSQLAEYKKDFTLSAQYEKSRFFLLPYDADFGGHFFLYDRSPMSPEGKAYSTDLWQLPGGALLAMMSREAIDDPYYRTYVEGEKRYRDFVYSHYLTVPDEVKKTIASIHPVKEAKTLSEKRQCIEDIYQFLKENYSYTRNPGITPKEKDFISYFLTESKKGYCTSFASAAVMLLRSSGIPARYAVGLTVDEEEINAAPLLSDGLHGLAINDHHAHAWAEVYVDGLGWRPVEMTPGKEGGENPFPIPPQKEKNNTGAPNAPAAQNPQPQRQEEQSPKPSSSPKNPQSSPESTLPPQASPTSPAMATRSLAFRWLLLPLPVILLLLFWRLTKIPRLLSANVAEKDNFRHLLSYGRRLSRWAGHPSDGSYESRAASYRSDPRFAGFDTIISLLVKTKFSGMPLTAEEKKEIQEIIRASRNASLEELSFLKQLKFKIVDGL